MRSKLCPPRPGRIGAGYLCLTPGYLGVYCRRGAARARRRIGGACRGADAAAPRRRADGLRQRGAGDRQDLAREAVPATISTAARGCCSAPATTFRFRGRWARFATSRTVSARARGGARGRRGAARHPGPPDRGARAPAAADRARARGRALGRRRDARLDHRARAADRHASGAARARPTGAARRRPGHPLHAALGAIRRRRLGASRARAPVARARWPSLAGEDADELYAATGGNPFYVTELLASRDAAELPPSVANAVLARASRLDDAARRLVELVSVVPNRVSTSLLDAVMPGWAAAAEEPERRQLLEMDARYVRFRHELARNAVRSSIPIAARRRLHAEVLDALLAADADPADIVHHAEAAGATTSSRVRARRRAPGGGARVEPGGVLPLPAGRRTSSSGCRALEQADHARGAGHGRLPRRPARRRLQGDRARDRDPPRLGRPGRASADARGSCRGSTGSPATAPLRARRRSRRSRSSSRSASRSSSPAPTAASRSWRCSPRTASRRSSGVSGRSSSRPGSATRAPARTRSSTSAAPRSSWIRATSAPCSRRTRSPTRRASARTRRARSATSATSSCPGPSPSQALRYAQRALAYAETYEVHTYVSYVTTALAWLRLRRGDWDEAERITRERDRERHHGRPAARQDRAGRAGRPPGRPGRARSAGRPRRACRPRRRAAADRAGDRTGDRVGPDVRRADARPSGSSSSPSRCGARRLPRALRGPLGGLGGRGRARHRARRAGVRAVRRHDAARLGGGGGRLRRAGLDRTTGR